LESRFRTQLDAWRKDLINLTRNNRLLYLKLGSVLEAIEPGPVEIYRQLDAGLRVARPPQPNLFQNKPTSTKPNEVRFAAPARSTVEAKLRNLERTCTQTFMDRGLWVLYLGFGLLEWDEAPPTSAAPERVLSPLLLVPVKLERSSSKDTFQLKWADEDQRLNPALLAKLEEDFGLELRLPADEDEIEPGDLLASVAKQVASRKWRVYPRTVLSTFSFHKEPILRDLVKNEQQVVANDAVRALALGAESGVSREFDPIHESELDAKAPPEKTVTILDADSSQRKAIAAAAAGHSFVMDGPPGTGKSQTIANTIADQLAKGRTVLFVSEKAAALEIVFDRLKEAGLEEFVLELHSHKARRKEVAKALGKSLQTRVRADDPMADAEREQLRRRREELSSYVEALNAPRDPLGRTLHWVLGRIAQLQELLQAPPPKVRATELNQTRLARLTELGQSLGRAWGPVTRGEDFVWRDLAPGDWDAARRVDLSLVLEAAHARLCTVRDAAEASASEMRLPVPTDTEGAERVHRVELHLALRSYAHAPWLAASSLQTATVRLSEATRDAARVESLAQRLERELGPRWPTLSGDGPEPLQALVDAVISTCGKIGIDDSTSSPALQQRNASVKDGHSILTESMRVAETLADAFQVDLRQVSLKRTWELAQLAYLSREDDLPEAQWLAPGGLVRARAAVVRLRPLLAATRSLEAEVRPAFKRTVVGLDLEALCVRFKGAYRSPFRWFNSEFRRDRRALREVTQSGRLGRSELELLGLALKWKEAIQAFESAVEAASQVLGSYLRGESTDFERIDGAFALAEKILELAGTEISSGSLARQLSVGSEVSSALQTAAERIAALARPWEALRLSWADLEDRPLPDALARAQRIVDVTSAAAEGLVRIDSVGERPVQLGDALRWLRLRREHETTTRRFADQAAADLALFGPVWLGRNTDWGRLGAGLDWAAALRTILARAVPDDCAERLVNMPAPPTVLAAPLGDWTASTEAIVSNFAGEQSRAVHAVLRGEFDTALRLIEDLTATLDDIGEWYSYVNALEQLDEEGLGRASRFCLEREVAALQVGPILERAVLEAWADDVLKTDQRLRTIRADDRDALTAEFRRLDRRLIALSARDAIVACNGRRPSILHGDGAIIHNEAQKQKKHMPVRELMRVAREVIQAIKPCFMMSPVSVSQFLPAEIRFDLVIFDEASQVKPADAISSVYRGRQLVVAGDQKQLPPTSFFERMDASDDDEYDEEDPGQFESVLDLCKGSGAFTSLPLRWHYRSQHEHLIAYSNQEFYDGALVTFPGVITDAPDLGVELFFGEGVYRRAGQRDNPSEAARVVERVLFHAQAHPKLSVGVVAFSEAQASAIDAIVERMADEHQVLRRSEDRLSGLFIKNLETVQGDERDIIIFSMGYGRDESGKFLMNFGPLSRNGGERRLNVAITRARRKIEFVTSVKLSDFPVEVGALGAQHLRKYLDFAERRENRLGVLSIPVVPGQGDFESPFEIEVARVVKSWGYDVVPQVGCSEYRIDLGVRDRENASRFVLGIECDGAMYHSSRVARDRDRLRQEVLHRLGWRLHRIWGPSWYRQRKEQEKRLRTAIEGAMDGDGPGPRTSRPAGSREAPHLTTISWDSAGVPKWVTPYKSATVQDVKKGVEMSSPAARETLMSIMLSVVRAEGPVHVERVRRLARDAFRAERTGKLMQDAFDAALAALKRRERSLLEKRDFLWLDGQPVRVRSPRHGEPDSQRRVSEVPPQEIQEAVRRTVHDAIRIDRADLVTFVSRLFGWDRNGALITGAIENAVRALVKSGSIVADENALIPAPASTA
jgi:very-short-patch-repair endonuclease